MSLFKIARLSLSKIFIKRICCLSVGTLFLLAQLTTPSMAAAQSVIYTALGDSLAFGLFAPIGEGYVLEYAEDINTDTGVYAAPANLGIPGWTSSDLLDNVRGNFLFRLSIVTSSVVTLDIGGNDLLDARNSYKNKTCGGADNQDCLRATIATFKSNWSAILNEILSLRSTSNTVIRAMDVYNPFVNEDRGQDTWPNDQGNDFQVTKVYLDDLNNYIASTSNANNIPYARVYQEFNGPNGDHDPREKDYIAFDGLHPNGSGHAKIAELFRNLGYSPLR
ncbi:MAG: SGNH/GDSL hydrolase family protein [Blastocatellia bacterium]|nr:SGNH/GDSL hydrolase family protein [Blastocatellia bacterium]